MPFYSDILTHLGSPGKFKPNLASLIRLFLGSFCHYINLIISVSCGYHPIFGSFVNFEFAEFFSFDVANAKFVFVYFPDSSFAEPC